MIAQSRCAGHRCTWCNRGNCRLTHCNRCGGRSCCRRNGGGCRSSGRGCRGGTGGGCWSHGERRLVQVVAELTCDDRVTRVCHVGGKPWTYLVVLPCLPCCARVVRGEQVTILCDGKNVLTIGGRLHVSISLVRQCGHLCPGCAIVGGLQYGVVQRGCAKNCAADSPSPSRAASRPCRSQSPP